MNTHQPIVVAAALLTLLLGAACQSGTKFGGSLRTVAIRAQTDCEASTAAVDPERMPQNVPPSAATVASSEEPHVWVVSDANWAKLEGRRVLDDAYLARTRGEPVDDGELRELEAKLTATCAHRFSGPQGTTRLPGQRHWVIVRLADGWSSTPFTALSQDSVCAQLPR